MNNIIIVYFIVKVNPSSELAVSFGLALVLSNESNFGLAQGKLDDF